jgi:hypothetical protein
MEDELMVHMAAPSMRCCDDWMNDNWSPIAAPNRDRYEIGNVWTGGVLQEKNLETAALGLAPMYPAYLWSNSTAPGHYGYKRASDLISGKASKLGCSDPQFSVAPGRPVLHCVVHALADLGGKCG